MTLEQHQKTLENATGKPAKTNVDSTSDERVVNNTMRHEYRVLSDAEKTQMMRVKDLGLRFVMMCDEIGESRELSLAKTKMEEAVFWAVKHLTRDP